MTAEGAWTNQVQNRVIVGGLNGGVFVYSGTPALGNLISSIAGQAGTDQYGNAYLAGTVTYSGAGTFASRLNGSTLQFYTAPGPGGPWTAGPFVSITNSAGAGGLSLVGNYYTLQAGAPFTTALLAGDPSSPGTAETQHDLGACTGYTITFANYTMNALGRVEFQISMVGGGANAASVNFANTLPVAYRPSVTRTVPMSSNQASPTVLPRLAISTGGVVTAIFMANITSTFTGSGFMALTSV